MNEHDPRDERDPLADLPTRDAAGEVHARVVRRARAALEDELALSALPPWLAATRRIHRVAAPAALAGVVGLYLAWAIHAARCLLP